MCLVPGLADGTYLADEDYLSADLAIEVPRCGEQAGVSRRQLLERSGALGLGLAAGTGAFLGHPTRSDAATTAASSPPPGDHITMLGINGGPILSAKHSQPSLMLTVNGVQYLVDCGGDAPRQLINSGAVFTPLKEVFFTHHHFDHTAGLGELLTLGWAYPVPLKPGLRLWGPPPLAATLEAIKHAYAFGAKLFEIGADYPPWLPVGTAHEVSLPKRGIVEVMQDDNVIVHATRVFHGPEVHDAYAYRFDLKTSGKSVVFSGDTIPDQQLIALAKDADLLIHEVQMNSLIPLVLKSYAPSMRAKLRRHLEDSHTDVTRTPRIAKAANVKRLAFCHYGVGLANNAPSVFLKEAKKAAPGAHYGGEIIAPTELDHISI